MQCLFSLFPQDRKRYQPQKRSRLWLVLLGIKMGNNNDRSVGWDERRIFVSNRLISSASADNGLEELATKVRHMFEEIDYILEGQNAERFADLYAFYHRNDKTNSKDNMAYKKASGIKVPKIYWNLTLKSVLTMEWIDGIKLTEENHLREACLNRKQLIHEGLYCSLMQLLEVGFFHADPHPGNLVATVDGSLTYFDFGMVGDIPRHYRVGLIKVDFYLKGLIYNRSQMLCKHLLVMKQDYPKIFRE